MEARKLYFGKICGKHLTKSIRSLPHH